VTTGEETPPGTVFNKEATRKLILTLNQAFLSSSQICHTVVLISVSLTTNEVKRLFKYL
jgi:hypothetical protein